MPVIPEWLDPQNAEVCELNYVNYRYAEDFQNSIELVMNDREYVFWGLPIIQATKAARLLNEVDFDYL